jgi:hypothetical protein
MKTLLKLKKGKIFSGLNILIIHYLELLFAMGKI